MLNSVLLHLEGAEQAEPVIRLGVGFARRSEARVRGLTLLDTRRIESLHDCESAVYAVMEHGRHALAERQQEAVRIDLSRACLDAGLNFDVRRISGDPFHVLPQEARFHDLVITSVATNTSLPTERQPALSLHELIDLLRRGVQPMMILQSQQQEIGRVLLVYDGSEASGRAIRSFLGLGILADAEHRLLAIGQNESKARASLHEMADYCAARRRPMETGYACGKVRRVLLPYAEKWQADLVVLGVTSANRLLRRILGATAFDLLKKLPCGLYAAS